jgi:phosphatidyl-myo-inositol dimannoside synthase
MISREFPPGPGGIGTHAYQVANHLTKLGWEILVITRQDYVSDEVIKEFKESQSFQIVRIQEIAGIKPRALQRFQDASAWIKKFQPQLILASGDRAIWLCAALARVHGLPWVAVGHGTEFGKPASWIGRQRRRVTRWCFQQATAVVCVSHHTWDRMLAAGVQPRTGQVILNGADETTFHVLSHDQVEKFRSKLNLDHSLILLSVGQVDERKGQDLIIRALPIILKQFPDLHYLIVGRPSRKEKFAKLAKDLGVANHVRFYGQVETQQLVQFFNCCDVFVLASRCPPNGHFEGFGIVAVEAALCGKPAVVTNNSGLVEAITAGETGLTVPEENETAIAETVLSLLKNESLRKRMGEAARKRALENQTWKESVKQYDQYLRKVMEKF